MLIVILKAEFQKRSWLGLGVSPHSGWIPGVWVGKGFMGQIRREALWPLRWPSLLVEVTWGQLWDWGHF